VVTAAVTAQVSSVFRLGDQHAVNLLSSQFSLEFFYAPLVIHNFNKSVKTSIFHGG
jgi:hypothetical protein